MFDGNVGGMLRESILLKIYQETVLKSSSEVKKARKYKTPVRHLF
jgi:hypothetical protein